MQVYNNTLYDLIHPEEAVLSWVRVVTANTLTNNAQSWVDMFTNWNSGTYNCLWCERENLHELSRSGMYLLQEERLGGGNV